MNNEAREKQVLIETITKALEAADMKKLRIVFRFVIRYLE